MRNSTINLLGIEFDGKSSFSKGTALAPTVIRQCFTNGSSTTTAENGIDIFEDAFVLDKGNVAVNDYNDLFRTLKNTITDNSPFIIMGGDHSITYPIVKTLVQHHGTFDILHFDANPDLYHEYDNDKYSHACPFARIMEEKLASKLTQIGIRTLN